MNHSGDRMIGKIEYAFLKVMLVPKSCEFGYVLAINHSFFRGHNVCFDSFHFSNTFCIMFPIRIKTAQGRRHRGDRGDRGLPWILGIDLPFPKL